MTESHLSTVVTAGNVRQSLEAIRDLLAADADDVTWEKHKAECRCVCGMGDGRTRVAIVRELRAVIEAIEALPGGREATAVDDIVARASAKRDELAARRAHRDAVPASS